MKLHHSGILTTVLAALSLGTAANAELIYGYGTLAGSPTQVLFSFDSATPGTVSPYVAITGVTTGSLVGIDFRPSNGGLYGLGFDANSNNAQLFTLNLTTGAASAVGSSFSLGSISGAGGDSVGIGFNPVADALRVVTGNGANARVNATTGAVTFDTDIAYAPANPNATGAVPQIVAVDYTRALNGATRLYDIDQANNTLTLQNPPNGGVLTTVGNLGITSLGPNTTGFDISNTTDTAFFSTDTDADPDVQDDLYTVDLTNGMTTLVGAIGDPTLNTAGISIAIVPEPATVWMFAMGAAAFGVFYLRRRIS